MTLHANSIEDMAAPSPEARRNLKNIVIIASDSLRAKEFNNDTAPRLHAYCAARDDCFMSSHHYSNAWGTYQGVFTLFYSTMISHYYAFEHAATKVTQPAECRQRVHHRVQTL